MLETFKTNLINALIVDDRYILILRGLKNTLLITFFALIVGVVIGLVIAIIKVATRNNKKNPLGWLADIYITVIRGTPAVVQLVIISGSIMASSQNKILIAVVAFGINSGAYVAEIIRGGILSVDTGQTEAGRSLGLSASATMRKIVLPQAFKNVLPSLGNEIITLLKETSVAGYVAILDLTKAGNNIFSRTYNMTSMYVVALTYLVMVMGLSWLLSRLERRLAVGDRR